MVRPISALSPLFRCLSVVLLGCLALALPAQAIPGATDKVPAASLLVPFFETGIDSGVNPHDTLLAVNNYFGPVIIHYHVWNIDGTPTSIQGNINLGTFATWSAAMRDLITPASAFAKSQLSEGAFYRGFVTIDSVTANTAFNPKNPAFPFSATNGLEGHIYYTRLSQGSANGINMVPLEAVPAAANVLVQDFYSGSDNREEIDSDARACAQQLTTGLACAGDPSSPNLIDRIHTRTFGSVPLNGGTRVVVFTWNPFEPNGTGGPSQICANLGTCAEEYPVFLYNEAGTDVLGNPTIRLDHVVNVIEFTGEVPGWFSIWNVPDTGSQLQVFAMSFNSANAGVALNWDAIFEGWIVP